MADEAHDLVVVGAGVLGLATALLARRRHPAWSIVVLDRARPGSGASARSAAVVASYGPTPAHRELVARSFRCYREGWLAPFAAGVPAFAVVPRPALPELHERIVGPAPREADPGERSLVLDLLERPALPSAEALVAVPGGVLTVDTGALADAAFLTSRRVECRGGVEVVSVRPVRSGHRLRTAGGEEVAAARTVIATGPWRPPEVAGTSLPARFAAKRVAALHLTPAGGEVPAVFWPTVDRFLLPEGGRLLFSFPRDRWLRPGDDPSEGFGAEDLAAGTAALAETAAGLVKSVAGGRAHADAYASGRLPRVESDSAVPGLAWLWGGSGSGVALAPALAADALDTVTQGV